MGMMIEAANLCCRIGNKTILQPCFFDAEAGSITAVIGPNGAGKSTLVRLLAGDQPPSAGQVQIAGRPLGDWTADALARIRAVLTQHFGVPLPFSAEEIVQMGRYPYARTSTAAADQKIVRECLEEMDVLRFASRQFATLSGGEQQRVQMARVLAQLSAREGLRGKVLLLDEPTSSLDPLQQQLMLSKIRELARAGLTVLVVLHDLSLAAQYADKLLLLREGYLLAEGTVSEVLEPALLGVAFGLDLDILEQQDYPFPVLVPALHRRAAFSHPTKILKNGTNRVGECLAEK